MQDLKRQVLSYLVMVWRRRWRALALAWLVCLVGWTGLALMPSKFLATARIYVDTETLLSPLLKGMAVDIDMNRQIEVMQSTLLSRPNLEKVLRMTNLDLTVTNTEQRDALLKRLSAEIAIRPSGVHNMFTVEYANHERLLARNVVEALLTIFVESNVGSSRRDLEQARQFIDTQIAGYEKQLSDAEGRLADFKREHVELTQEASLASRLEAARQRLVQLKSSLDDAMTRRGALQAQLAQVPQFLDVQSAPQVIVEGGVRGPSELEARIAQVRKTLDDLKVRYTDEYPDVIAAKRMLASLKLQLPKDGGHATKAPASTGEPGTQKISNPVYEQIQLRMIDFESDVQSLQRQVDEQAREVDRLQQLSETAPAVEAELTSLNRDYSVLKTNYEQLLARRESAKLSQDVDSSSQKVEFRVIDPPDVPVRPSSPNRPLLMSVVLLVGIGCGAGLALLLAQMSDSFGTVHALRDAFPLPVLGSISNVVRRAMRLRQMAMVGCFALSFVLLLGVYGIGVLHTLSPQPLLGRLGAAIAPLRDIIQRQVI
jgi:polysaccharide chain length determinant protein (PEP-CTERM system associated)